MFLKVVLFILRSCSSKFIEVLNIYIIWSQIENSRKANLSKFWNIEVVEATYTPSTKIIYMIQLKTILICFPFWKVFMSCTSKHFVFSIASDKCFINMKGNSLKPVLKLVLCPSTQNQDSFHEVTIAMAVVIVTLFCAEQAYFFRRPTI